MFLVMAALFGCDRSEGTGDDARGQAEAAAQRVQDAAGEVVPAIASAVDAVGFDGSVDGRFEICGMEPSPSGVAYTAETAVPQADTAGAAQGDAIASALDGAGWTVESQSADTLTATHEKTTLRAQYGAAVSIQLRSACVDADEDTIRDLVDRDLDTFTVGE